jgi:predicted aconitase with swiveling domain
MAALARQAGYLDALEGFGGKLTVDTCILASPMLPPEVKTLMTNSAKYAYYAPGMLNMRVTFGSLADCVQSAVEGQVVRDDGIWSVPPGSPNSVNVEERDGMQRDSEDSGGTRRVVIGGKAEGELLVSREPISFWGGYDYHTGEIIDRRHPLSGKSAAGRILAVPFTRGSSTTTAVLLEAVRAGTAPAGIVTTGVDSFFALASIVADEMYGTPVPLLALPREEFAKLETGKRLTIAD